MKEIDRVIDAADGFHQCWYPLALADDVSGETPLGIDVLGTRVVVYRDATGTPVIQTAWCPHLGADLARGELIERQLRCPYHHWRFDRNGRCIDIPTGDKIPPGARIFTFPAAEAWGLVWAFNGRAPLFAPPRIPGIEESELVIHTQARPARRLPPWVGVSNGVDFQHLRALHNLQTSTPETIDVGDHAIEFRMETERYLQHGRITGTNVFAQHLHRDGSDVYMLFAGMPVDRHQSRGFFTVGVRNSGDDAEARHRDAMRLEGARRFVEQLLAEDDPVLNTMRFKIGVLTASDRHLARYFKYVAEFPRAEAPA